MKSSFKFIIFILILSLVSFFVYGAITVNQQPSDGATLTSRTVNHSIIVNVTQFNPIGGIVYNVTFYRNGTIINYTTSYVNNTFYSFLLNTTNGAYSWYINVSNGTNYSVSPTYSYTVAETIPTLNVALINPSVYDIETTTAVNFTWMVNATGGFLGANEINCSVYNRSSSSSNYSLLGWVISQNATQTNLTKTINNDIRTWWYVNCTTTYHQNAPVVSSVVNIFDVDTVLQLYQVGYFGKINFTLDTGAISTAGPLRIGGNITLPSPNGTLWTCGVNNSGFWNCTGVA